MYQVTSNYVIEEQTLVNGDKKIILKMEYGSGWVNINDESFNPNDLDKDRLVISDYSWEDYSFEDNDDVVFESVDENLVEELEEIFEENYYEGLEEAGWSEEDTVVTFIGYEIS